MNRRSLSIFVPTLLYVVVGLLLFGYVGDDDDYITFWQALSLAEGHGIRNISGAVVEQSSSLLHSVLLAALYRVTGLPFPVLALAVSVCAGVLACLATARLARMLDRRAEAPAVWVLVSMYPFTYWTFGGLETALVSLLTTVTVLQTVVLVRARRLRVGNLVALAGSSVALLLARPEAPLVLICTLGGGVAILAIGFLRAGTRSRRRLRTAALRLSALLAFVALVAGAVALWRYATFGLALPLASAVKGGATLHTYSTLRWALRYVCYRNVGLLPLWLLALSLGALVVGNVFALRRLEITALVTTLMLVAYGSFIVLVGGDWMEMGRFFAHCAPLASVLAVSAVLRFSGRTGWGLAVLLLVATNVAFLYIEARKWSTGTPGLVPRPFAQSSRIPHSWPDRMNRVHLREIPLVDSLDNIVATLRRANPDRKVTLLSGQAGNICFHVGARHFDHVQFLDMYGITDRTLTACDLMASRMRLHPNHALPKRIHYAEFFEALDDAGSACGVPVPDVIFDVGSVRSWDSGIIARSGYTVVFQQDGRLWSANGFFTGQELSSACFIAVRDDLVGLLDPSDFKLDKPER